MNQTISLKNVDTVIKFDQEACLKPETDMKTELDIERTPKMISKNIFLS